jgi:hypothetical protein
MAALEDFLAEGLLIDVFGVCHHRSQRRERRRDSAG